MHEADTMLGIAQSMLSIILLTPDRLSGNPACQRSPCLHPSAGPREYHISGINLFFKSPSMPKCYRANAWKTFQPRAC